MYAKMSVGLEEALGAIHAMLDEVKSQPEKYWQEACFAIVDERGKLVAFAKMDGPDQICQDVAIRKAWTAAIWRRDIQEVNEFIKTREWGLDDFLPGATAIVGGVAITDRAEDSITTASTNPKGKLGSKPSCIGGIGVSRAGPWYIDQEVARVGLKYIQDKLWSKI